MGRKLILVLLAAVVALGLAGCVAAGALPAGSSPAAWGAGASTRYVTVVGRGEAKAKPDIASLDVGVQTKAEKVSDAVSQAQAVMNEVLAALAEQGIAKDDIRTSNYSIYLDEGYRGPDAEPQPTYRVFNSVNIIVRDLNKVSAVLDAVVAAGANQVYGVSFTLEDWHAVEAEAREKAMADAGERAQHLAQLAGLQLGQVLSVSEVVGTQPTIMPVAAERAAAGLGGGAGPVEPGQLTYSTTIQVTYELK
jgi:uncharacterized protein YggE